MEYKKVSGAVLFNKKLFSWAVFLDIKSVGQISTVRLNLLEQILHGVWENQTTGRHGGHAVAHWSPGLQPGVLDRPEPAGLV